MHVMYFTEQPMSAYPSDIGLEAGHTALMFSNKHFDPVAGSRLYNQYLEHYIYGQEQLATGVNPAFNRERFEEAHDLVVAAWSRQGPFRWEGTHFQHRVVNPWAVPLQKPYPRVWIPGVLSRETVIWTAQQRYPYIALNTAIDATKVIWDTYSKAAAEVGYTAGPENFGYLIRVHVQDTMEKALQNARQFIWMQSEFTELAH